MMRREPIEIRTGSGVLACAVPPRPGVHRLALSLEGAGAGALSVRAWLGDDDEGTQLEMIGALGEVWEPWLVTLSGLDTRGSLAEAIAARFGVSLAEAAEVERLVMRSDIVGSIAVEAGGVEGLQEFELQVRDRLAEVEGLAA